MSIIHWWWLLVLPKFSEFCFNMVNVLFKSRHYLYATQINFIHTQVRWIFYTMAILSYCALITVVAELVLQGIVKSLSISILSVVVDPSWPYNLKSICFLIITNSITSDVLLLLRSVSLTYTLMLLHLRYGKSKPFRWVL